MTKEEFKILVDKIFDKYDWYAGYTYGNENFCRYVMDFVSIAWQKNYFGISINIESILFDIDSYYIEKPNDPKTLSEIEILIDNCVRYANKYQMWMNQCEESLRILDSNSSADFDYDFKTCTNITNMKDLLESVYNN